MKHSPACRRYHRCSKSLKADKIAQVLINSKIRQKRHSASAKTNGLFLPFGHPSIAEYIWGYALFDWPAVGNSSFLWKRSAAYYPRREHFSEGRWLRCRQYQIQLKNSFNLGSTNRAAFWKPPPHSLRNTNSSIAVISPNFFSVGFDGSSSTPIAMTACCLGEVLPTLINEMFTFSSPKMDPPCQSCRVDPPVCKGWCNLPDSHRRWSCPPLRGKALHPSPSLPRWCLLCDLRLHLQIWIPHLQSSPARYKKNAAGQHERFQGP